MNRTATLLLCGFFVLLLGLPAQAQSSSDEVKPLKMVTVQYGSIDMSGYLLGMSFQHYLFSRVGYEIGYEYNYSNQSDPFFPEKVKAHRVHAKLHYLPIYNNHWLMSLYIAIGGSYVSYGTNVGNSIDYKYSNEYRKFMLSGTGIRLQRYIIKGIWAGLDFSTNYEVSPPDDISYFPTDYMQISVQLSKSF